MGTEILLVCPLTIMSCEFCWMIRMGSYRSYCDVLALRFIDGNEEIE